MWHQGSEFTKRFDGLILLMSWFLSVKVEVLEDEGTHWTTKVDVASSTCLHIEITQIWFFTTRMDRKWKSKRPREWLTKADERAHLKKHAQELVKELNNQPLLIYQLVDHYEFYPPLHSPKWVMAIAKVLETIVPSIIYTNKV